MPRPPRLRPALRRRRERGRPGHARRLQRQPVALQLPKSALALNGDASARQPGHRHLEHDRPSAAPASPATSTRRTFIQVSRLGNPLVNEVVIPLALKDAFNSIRPRPGRDRSPAAVDAVENPILPELIQAIYGVPAPATPRNDLSEIFLQGISKANAGLSGDPAVVLPVDLNAQDLNARRRSRATIQPSEMLRLNMSRPGHCRTRTATACSPATSQGFPNGRRLTDDVVDIAIQAVEGAAQTGQLVARPAHRRLGRPQRPAVRGDVPVPRRCRTSTASTTAPSARRGHPSSSRSTRPASSRPGAPSPAARSATPARSRRPARRSRSRSPAPGAGSRRRLGGGPQRHRDQHRSDGVRHGVPVWHRRDRSTSNFNPIAGQITHNLVVAKVGTNGKVCIYTCTATDLIADLSGYHPSTAAYAPNVARAAARDPHRPAGRPERLDRRPSRPPVRRSSCRSPASARRTCRPTPRPCSSTSPRSTPTAPAGSSPTRAGRRGRRAPRTSTRCPGLVRANLVAAKVGAGGKVCLYTYSATDIVVDLMGSAPAASSFVATAPERVLETRATEGQINYSGARPIAGQTIEVKVIGFGTTKIPADAGTVLLNVTAVDPATRRRRHGVPVRLAACRWRRTSTSPGSTDANLVSVKVGDGGRVCIYTSGSTRPDRRHPRLLPGHGPRLIVTCAWRRRDDPSSRRRRPHAIASSQRTITHDEHATRTSKHDEAPNTHHPHRPRPRRGAVRRRRDRRRQPPRRRRRRGRRASSRPRRPRSPPRPTRRRRRSTR